MITADYAINVPAPPALLVGLATLGLGLLVSR